MRIYLVKRIDCYECSVNEWLYKMSKFKSFRPISISVDGSATILYSIDTKDEERSEK